MRIAVIDPDRKENWPSAVPPGIRRYLTALSRTGPSRLAENAKGVVGEILRVGELVLPVLVSDGAPGKALILSPLAHHVYYPIQEIGRTSRILGRLGLRALVSPLELTLRAGALDRVAFINHWLLSGAPPPEVPAPAWPQVFSYLADRHPSHALLVQDIKPSLAPAIVGGLDSAGAVSVPTRTVAIVDPAASLEGQRFRRVRYKRARGRSMIHDAMPDLAALPNATRQAELYLHSNVARHSNLNPAYLQASFQLALSCEEFTLHAWRAPRGVSDKVAAFNLQRMDSHTIHSSTFGAEPSERKSDSYCERIAATDIAVSEDRNLLLDWGAGADEFKRLKGAAPHAQMEFAYIEHLPAVRRTPWLLLAWLRHVR